MHEVIPIGEALAQKEQHNGQPQHWETSRPTLFEQCVGPLTSHIELINMEGIVRRDLRLTSKPANS